MADHDSKYYLTLEDIKDNLVVIKINQTYKECKSAEALYDYTRGIWRRNVESEKSLIMLCVLLSVKLKRYMKSMDGCLQQKLYLRQEHVTR